MTMLSTSPCCRFFNIDTPGLAECMYRHIGNEFRLLRGEALVLGTSLFASWLARRKHDPNPPPPSSFRNPRPIQQSRYVAFPLHEDSPGHWTLCILVNLKWIHGKRKKPRGWICLHLDSFYSSPSMSRIIQDYSKYLLEPETDEDLPFFHIPVAQQPVGSNDCGLYPAHYLRIFLQDPEQFISVHCYVSDVNALALLSLTHFLSCSTSRQPTRTTTTSFGKRTDWLT